MQLTKPRNLERVVVTGMGGETPQGDLEQTWASVLGGKSVIKPVVYSIQTPTEVGNRGRIKKRTTVREEVYLTAPLPDGWDNELDPKDKRRTDVNGQLLVLGIGRALNSACLTERDRTDVGLITGTNLVFTEYNVDQIECYIHFGVADPLAAAKVMINNAAGYGAIRYGLGGPNFALSSACASGSMAVGEAFRKVQYGDAPIMLAAGVEGATHPQNLYAFEQAKAYSTSLDKGAAASRPGSCSRDGFVMGNGCVVLVLESLNSALDRGAPILAEIIGYGNTDDKDSLYDPPEDGEGLKRAIIRSLQDAEIYDQLAEIADQCYYNGHTTGTPNGDSAELMAIRDAFGPKAVRMLKMSFTKSSTGHLLGCAGALEAALCVMVIQDQLIPPTINLDDPDTKLGGLQVVKDNPLAATINYTISPSAGFGGHNGCVVIRKWKGE